MVPNCIVSVVLMGHYKRQATFSKALIFPKKACLAGGEATMRKPEDFVREHKAEAPNFKLNSAGVRPPA